MENAKQIKSNDHNADFNSMHSFQQLEYISVGGESTAREKIDYIGKAVQAQVDAIHKRASFYLEESSASQRSDLKARSDLNKTRDDASRGTVKNLKFGPEWRRRFSRTEKRNLPSYPERMAMLRLVYRERGQLKAEMKRNLEAEGTGVLIPDYSEIFSFKSDGSKEKRDIWSCGYFDFDGSHAFEYEKFLESRLSQEAICEQAAVNSSIRFTLPFDLTTLKDCTILKYLSNYCNVSKELRIVYERAYSNLNKSVEYLVEDVVQIIKERLTGIFDDEQIREFKCLTDLEAYEELTFNEFCGLLALAERLYGIKNPMVQDNDMWRLLPGPLEKIDFEKLASRIQGNRINPKLERLLLCIAETTKWKSENLRRNDQLHKPFLCVNLAQTLPEPPSKNLDVF